MRVSNLHVTKGSIIYAEFNKEGDLAYLNDRPLLAVSYPTNIYNTIMICSITSQLDKPGIFCHLYNYASREDIGGNRLSVISPNTIHTIQIENVTSVVGVMDRFIMEEVDKAIKYFLGFSNEFPEFLTNMRSELTTVEPSMILNNSLTYIQNPSGCFGSRNLRQRQLFNPMTYDINTKAQSLQGQPAKNNVSKLATDENHKEQKQDTPKESEKSQLARVVDDMHERWTSTTQELPPMTTLLQNPTWILQNINIRDLTMVVGRIASIRDIARKYNISSGNARVFRKLVENTANDRLRKFAAVFMKDIKGTIEQMNSYDFMSLVVLGKLHPNDLFYSSFRDRLNSEWKIKKTLEEYPVNFENMRVWKDTVNA
jgi:mRNA-degrading endonuclease toxin of MazEF toxin-antitoxin module